MIGGRQLVRIKILLYLANKPVNGFCPFFLLLPVVVRDSYIGKAINDYDNKQAFTAAIRAYQKALEGDVLDRSFDNTAAIDLEEQRRYIESKGIDTSGMD